MELQGVHTCHNIVYYVLSAFLHQSRKKKKLLKHARRFLLIMYRYYVHNISLLLFYDTFTTEKRKLLY